MKLTTKLALALSGTMVLALGGYGFLSVQRQIEVSERDMLRDDQVLGQVLAVTILDLWRREGPTQALEILRRLDPPETPVEVRWLWLDEAASDPHLGDLGAEARERLAAGLTVSRADPPRRPARSLRTWIPLRAPDGRLGLLEVSDPLSERDELIESTLSRLALLALLIMVLSSLVAWGLGVWLVGRPVQALVQKARRVGRGDLSGPLVLSQADELGLLASEMNLMCEHLEAARRSILEEEGARQFAEKQLRHAERLATVGALVAGIAHELGTPLNVITGRAGLIADGHLEEDEVRDSAHIVREQAQRITHIVKQLLEFARRSEPRASRVNLGDLLERTVSLLRSAREDDEVLLTWTPPDEPLEVLADAGQLQQVISNLVVNAFQAMGHAGTVAVTLARDRRARPGSGEPPRPVARVEVQDDGPGIAPEYLPHIFEPFFTTKEVGQGTGLGLSVSYGIVEEHDGWIEVASPPGQGARFGVFLPLVPEEGPP